MGSSKLSNKRRRSRAVARQTDTKASVFRLIPYTIVVDARGDTFHAQIKETGHWAAGKSRQEAIGSLFMTRGVIAGVSVCYTPACDRLATENFERAMRDFTNNSKG